MSRPVLAVVTLAALGAAWLPAVTAAPTPGPASNTSATIVELCPNPVADGDAGEFVTIALSDSPPDSLTLADDDAAVALSTGNESGRVTFWTAPNRTRALVDGTVRQLPVALALANGGENVTLARGNRTVDRVSYDDAPEGAIGRPGDDGIEWRPVGATDFDVLDAAGGRVTAFVLPDAGALPVRTLASAQRRVRLAGYTLTSRRVVAALVNASRRGVDVRVLVDADPVGGMNRREARALDRLAATNVSVSVLGGPRARYDYHHAKYAVVDDRALVLTENW
ncbi:MAG: phospholipase D-like domain-containing protein, partial [Haloarculaceae archaeon]